VYESILFDASDAVATITLNRPEKLNAYTVAMGEEVVDAFRRVRDDARLRAVVLAGAGRAFCAGVDLDALRAHQAGAAAPGPRLGEEDFLRKLPLELLAYPKPVIAAIHGSAIGVGVTMTLPCDLRIAAEGTKLGLTFAKLGLLPGLGSTHLLPRLVGLGKALELVLTARVVEAREAAAMGLVNRVVPADSLVAEARETARALAELRPEVLAAAKAALHFGAGAGMADAMRNEQQASALLRKR
jgi:2-(1,2-epoxy-1,2-dihydrophenyl)acetyl-CoA isomerase